jgi:hypothetical protein
MEASAHRGFKLEGFLFDFRLWALAEGETRPDGGGPQAPQGAGCSALISGAGRCVRLRRARSFPAIPAWLAVIAGRSMPSV